ncbi:MAG: FtsQ-type POTRA domain-containing protein [Pseudomonadota bacterium]|nr:FtsQ-type POTRA domain-containing protein [Pseudomonadota bacterium]
MSHSFDVNPFKVDGNYLIFKNLLVFVFILTSILVSYLILIKNSNLFPIKEVYIDGDLKYLDQEKLKVDIARYTTTGFFQIELKKISQLLQDDHWVSEVSVRKIWPSSVLVKIRERTPMAKLNKDRFFDEQGNIFQPLFVPPIDILQIDDLSGDPKALFFIANQINEKFVENGLSLKGLKKTKLGIIKAELADSKEVVLGYEDNFQDNLVRFTNSYQSVLKPLWFKIAKVDLRHGDGFAVRFEKN